MVFAESFLLKLPGGLRHGHGYAHLRPYHVITIGDAIELASDELETRVTESGAAVVDNGDPAIEVGVLVVAGDGKDVNGIHGKIVRQIVSLDLLFFRARVCNDHQYSGALL